MTRPAFSVVIPTKNRARLVPYAVQSVLSQTFGDLEVVVVDNDDSDATRRTVEGLHDPRIRYVRTGGLSMPDNWERGLAEAEGAYLTILEDKMVLRRRALERIRQVIETQGMSVVTWAMGKLQRDGGEPPLRYWERPTSGACIVNQAEALLARFTSEDPPINDLMRLKQWTTELPIAVHCCFRREVAEAIRQGPLGRLCPPVSPDYTLCFALLAYAERVACVDEVLVVEHSSELGTGRRLRRSFAALDPGGRRFVEEVGGEEAFYRGMPIQGVLSVNNALFSDYEAVRARVRGRLDGFPVRPAKYFALCYLDICKAGVHRGERIGAELRAWRRAFNAQPVEVRAAARRYLRSVGWPVGWKMAFIVARRVLRGLADHRGWWGGSPGGPPPDAAREGGPNKRFASIAAFLEWDGLAPAVRQGEGPLVTR